MERAANEDIESNKLGKPAVAKLKILSQVIDVLQKSVSFRLQHLPWLTFLRRIILDNL